MKKHPILFSVCLCVISVILTYAVCSVLIVGRFGGSDGFRDAMKFAEARAVLEHYYIGDFDSAAIVDGAMDGMIAATGDRWSYYMNAEEYEEYKEYSANQYQGIGITVTPSEDGRGLVIVEVLADSPADKAGVRAGMLLVKVNDVDMSGSTAAHAREVIMAASEEDILLVTESAEGETMEFTVRTEVLKVEVVSDELLEENIGYIRIANFEDGSADGTIAALNSLLAAGAEGIVFDVRSNPGGQLNELVKLLDYLLPEGTLFVSQNKSGKEVLHYSATECVKCPMAVLVNGDSYSAAEFFAAALSEYDWAAVVGEPTTGKSRSQINLILSDGSVLHISTANYLTPNRVDLTETGGLMPDVLVLPEDGEEDVQLMSAVQYLLENQN